MLQWVPIVLLNGVHRWCGMRVGYLRIMPMYRALKILPKAGEQTLKIQATHLPCNLINKQFARIPSKIENLVLDASYA